MKFAPVLFALLLAMCGAVLAAIVVGERPQEIVAGEQAGTATVRYLGHGVKHPKFESMLHGGPGAVRHGPILWIGLTFGLLQIVLFVCLLALGGQRQGKLGPLKIPLIVAGIVYAGVFIAMVVSYRGYMAEQDHATFLALPVPTAWMIYGVWPAPIIFMLIYMVTFDSWIYRSEDQVRLEEILACHSQMKQGTSATGDAS